MAQSRFFLTAKNYPLSMLLIGYDAEQSPLTFTIISGPEHGKLTGTAPRLTYTPDMNYTGTDSFTFVVSDGELTSAPATVSLSTISLSGGGVVRRR
jgi:hypothetical protein